MAYSLKFTTPKGKIVYGGGGIIPDVFVPIDNSLHNETLMYIQRHGFIAYFVFEELEKDRQIYSGISRQDFIDNFEVGQDLVFAFEDYLNVRTKSEISFQDYHDKVKQYLKATLADQLYGNGAFEEVFNKHDMMIKEIVKLSEAKQDVN